MADVAWKVCALVKLSNFASAELELERLGGDLDLDDGCPFALRWCAADLPARVGRPADGAAAFARLSALCDRRAASEEEGGRGGEEREKGTEKKLELWRGRAEAACWAAAGISARGEDPCAARAWARAALDRRARRLGGEGGGAGGAPFSSSSGPPPSSQQQQQQQQPCWQPPLAAGAEALSAAARLELALGEPSEARRLFSAAAAAAAAKAEAAEAAAAAATGGAGTGEAPAAASAASAARAAALLRLSAGDASRAAAAFGAIPEPSPTDANNEALCLLHSGDVSRARAVAFESLLLLPSSSASSSSSSSTSTLTSPPPSSPSPLLFSGAALRTAAALADLAPPVAARAARDALFDAVQAAGAPEDLDANFLAAA